MKMTFQTSWVALVLLTHNGEVINLNLGCSDLNLLSFCLFQILYYLQKGQYFFLPYPSKFTVYDHDVISFTATSAVGKAVAMDSYGQILNHLLCLF